MARPKSQWELNYCQHQAAINGWVRENYRPRLVAVAKFLIYPPEEYRRYLRQSPCQTCRACPCCDVPCEVYLDWYNRRLEAARARAGM